MSTSERYVKFVAVAKKDGKYFMEKLKKLVKWKENASILDVGCGPGNVTHNFLLPALPKSASLTAIDKAADAIHYANEHYGNSSQVTFRQMDIVSPDPNFSQTFDHIFSFYCLHFIFEQEIALRNIYKMLNFGGDFFFTCAVQCEIFQVISNIFGVEKWAPYISDYKKHTSPYQHSKEPRYELEQMLLRVGFEVSFLNSEPREHYYPINSAKDVVLSIHSINIPEDLKEEFHMDVVKTVRDIGCSQIKGGEEFYRTKYQILFGYATKPKPNL
ncbi:hypothetical protein RI129_011327 [Pyrocoelia pectoralis]|uniref:Methyltransferase domain-containing protein n=1 Tax=Pyrocoelia pectoralis TaxID=417401 RepID=A0AAN7V8Q1_9COLE